MAASKIDLDMKIHPDMPSKLDWGIGCIGSGFIMKDIQLVAYQNAGFRSVAIASRTRKNAEAAAAERGVPKVHDSWQDLIRDPDVQVLDVAFPPDLQVEIIKEAAKQEHIQGILAQKPLAMNAAQALEAVEACEATGTKLAVNSNMRYDQSIRALKTVLERGHIGEPVMATIDMRAIPHWQPFLEDYDRLTMLNMSIHHIDVFRYLFGDPTSVFASVRKDPRTQFDHTDGIAMYIMDFPSGLKASSLDDVWAWPGEGAEQDIYIRWRVEGTNGMAKGTIGWPSYPTPTPSTIDFTTKDEPGYWFQPRWNEVWFPDAFAGTMAQLLRAIETNAEPEIGGRDNLKTLELIDACYRSVEEKRVIDL